MFLRPEPPDVPEVTVDDLAADPDPYVLDVREPYEYTAGHVAGSVLMPVQQVPRRLDELPSGRVHVMCHVGQRSLRVAAFLRGQGLDAVSVLGGTDAWERSGRPLEPGLS